MRADCANQRGVRWVGLPCVFRLQTVLQRMSRHPIETFAEPACYALVNFALTHPEMVSGVPSLLPSSISFFVLALSLRKSKSGEEIISC